ncbi:MAG TPA: fluoride efflux transporter CrcB [Ktedonobacteraceae bacterium]
MAGQTLSLRRGILAVCCGGFMGTLVRYSLSLSIQGWLGKSWPYDILAINLSGALLLALISTLADKALLIGPTRRLLINTGFMGAYTTFSSLALGDLLLLSKGQLLPALLYLVVSLLGGLGAVLLGDWLGLRLIALLRRSHTAPAITSALAKAEEISLVDEAESRHR